MTCNLRHPVKLRHPVPHTAVSQMPSNGVSLHAMCVVRWCDACVWCVGVMHHTCTHHTLARRTRHLSEMAMSCYTLQHTATHCNILQHTATHCNINTLQHSAPNCNILQHTTQLQHGTWQHTAALCTKLQHTATYCNTLHNYNTASVKRGNILQHTAIHCNTQHNCNTAPVRDGNILHLEIRHVR